MARHERERARKAIARRSAIRRALTIAGVVTVLSVGAYLVFFNVRSPGDVSAQALEVAAAAGCGDIVTPAAEAPEASTSNRASPPGYTEHPATSGLDPSPLPSEPAVHTEPIREENAVHNLEHGYVILYYRADGPEALSVDVLARLAQIAEGQDKVLVAPYPDLEGAPRSRSPLGTSCGSALRTCRRRTPASWRTPSSKPTAAPRTPRRPTPPRAGEHWIELQPT